MAAEVFRNSYMTELNLEKTEDGSRFTRAAVPVYLEYEEPPLQMVEILRYSGVPIDAAKRILADPSTEEEKSLLEKVEKVIALSKGQIQYKVGYLSGVLEWDEEGFPMLPVSQKSENLKKNLRNCEGFVMFAATIGSGIDRLIRRFEVSDPSMGVIFQGYGAERAESLCNLFCEEVRVAAEEKGYKLHPRFSPGFGDLPITVQKEFLDRLDASRRLGITLGESCLMSPSKSVTAFIGLERITER